MEEDIKILEKIKDIFIHLKNYWWINDIKRDIDTYKAIQSIENLIKGYKEIEEEIKKINKQLDLDYVDKNYIPVSLVEEKIEELWIKCPKNSINRFMINERNNKIAVLQELLEKRK